ncbi:MAG TPA: hypothetical protein VII44_10610 [Puia sp.]
MSIRNYIFLFSGKLGAFLRYTFLISLLFNSDLQAQPNGSNPNQGFSGFGYSDKGDSVEFIFGQQLKIIVSGVEILLANRINDINQVNVAGDFNGWNPDAFKYQMNKVDGKLFKITLSKNSLGKKGELKQFKFVLNHKYWVEPPAEASNKFTGKDGYTNLTLRL